MQLLPLLVRIVVCLTSNFLLVFSLAVLALCALIRAVATLLVPLTAPKQVSSSLLFYLLLTYSYLLMRLLSCATI
jgi:hypothetical protein